MANQNRDQERKDQQGGQGSDLKRDEQQQQDPNRGRDMGQGGQKRDDSLGQQDRDRQAGQDPSIKRDQQQQR